VSALGLHLRRPTTRAARGAPPPTLVDGAFAAVLATLALVGLGSVYGGASYLLVGIVGVVVGLVVTGATRHWRLPVAAEVGLGAAAFLLLAGPIAAPATTLGGVVPTPATVVAIAHAAVFGWKELLTLQAPVGNTSNLLTLPFLLGLVASATATSIAGRTRLGMAPLAGPALGLSLAILFGAPRPTSLLLQGSLFAGLAVAWVALRQGRRRSVLTRSGRQTRRGVVAAALVAGAALGGRALGPVLPGASAHARVVLSRYVLPPFEASDQPSPLAGFRRYVQGSPLYDQVLFTTTGLPAGSLVRIATMDSYDGLVWGFDAGQAGSATADSFRHPGARLGPEGRGPARTVSVTLGALGGVWVPLAGAPGQVHFDGPDSAALSAAFLFDRATETGAEPLLLAPGDRYTMRVTLPPTPSAAALDAAGPAGSPIPTEGAPAVLVHDASAWTAGVPGTWQKVVALATHLRSVGYYSNGGGNPTLSLPGESTGRLQSFLAGGGLVGTEIVGDDEQYAAALALMANSLGIPTRVVLGAAVGTGGVVEGRDVHAWVQVSLTHLGWVPLTWSAFLPSRPPHPVPLTQHPTAAPAARVEPPLQTNVQSPLEDLQSGATSESQVRVAHRRPAGFALPTWVLAAIGILAGLVVLAAAEIAAAGLFKARRRRRRRNAATPSAQVAGGWAELLDLATDAGLAVAAGTRREQAVLLAHREGGPGILAASTLAAAADGAVFGPGEPSPIEVAEFWGAVGQARDDAARALGRFGHLRLTASLRSLRPASAGDRTGTRARTLARPGAPAHQGAPA